MWYVTKILNYPNHFKLSRWCLPINNSESNSLRQCYKNTPKIHENVNRRCSYRLERIKNWLSGKASIIVENAVRAELGMELLIVQKESKIVYGWLPSLNPSVIYDLRFNNDYVKEILWIERVPMTLSLLRTTVFPFAVSKCKHMINKSSVGKKLKSNWQAIDWSTINRSNVRGIWLCVPRATDIMESSKQEVEDCILVDESIYLCIWENLEWLKTSTPSERLERWNELKKNPESVLSQGTQQYQKLMIFLNREIPDDMEDLALAYEFMKKTKIRLWIPHDQFSGSKYVKRYHNGWALEKDLKDTEQILSWSKNVPLYAGYNKSYVDIPLDTPVFLKHPDDKMQWWSKMSYYNVHVGFENMPKSYIIGEAHRLSQEDWVKLSTQNKPLAIFGRTDLFDMNARGHVFFDLCHCQNVAQNDIPICNNTVTISYGDPLPEVPSQFFVSHPSDKEFCNDMSKRLNRVWMFHPKRIATRVGSMKVMESDCTTSYNKNWVSANVVCCYESYQRVEIAALLITKHTKPEHVYHVKSCANTKVILVEKDAGVPNLPYRPIPWNSLINVQ